mmetsp:Transcript_44705/g.143194  ORF Transcript_44705/g.143194 Transcript_44705/m.143194 type:complete len:326 (+) Transcript_44705:72-1049(+)
MIHHAGPAPGGATWTGAGGQPTYVNAGYAGQQFAQYSAPQQLQPQMQQQPQVAQTMAAPAQAASPIKYLPPTQHSGAMPAGGVTGAVPPPATPKMTTAAPLVGTAPSGAITTRIVSAGGQAVPTMPGQVMPQQATMPQQTTMSPQTTMQVRPSYGQVVSPQTSTQVVMTAKEQMLEQRVRELEQAVAQKDRQIKDLQGTLAKAGIKIGETRMSARSSPGRSASSGFRQLTGATPSSQYQAIDQDDPVDVRLEEFYNSTGSAVPFRRINKGFYRFGDTITELSIINHKLMARTEDGWNRGKSGPIEKFLMYYENIERERAGLPLEA